jgi:hypothetical protein
MMMRNRDTRTGEIERLERDGIDERKIQGVRYYDLCILLWGFSGTKNFCEMVIWINGTGNHCDHDLKVKGR